MFDYFFNLSICILRSVNRFYILTWVYMMGLASVQIAMALTVNVFMIMFDIYLQGIL